MQQLEAQSAMAELTSSAIELEGEVGRVLALLNAAASGKSVANALFEAVVAIQRGCKDRATAGSIDLQQRGRLLTAWVSGWAGAETYLQSDCSRASFNSGGCALAYQITMWAESLEETSRRNPDDVLDYDEGARIFQNELQNIILRSNKAERVRELRARPNPLSPAHSV